MVRIPLSPQSLIFIDVTSTSEKNGTTQKRLNSNELGRFLFPIIFLYKFTSRDGRILVSNRIGTKKAI
jgi:hypothetical protein